MIFLLGIGLVCGGEKTDLLMEILQILAITLLTSTLFGLFYRALDFFDQLIKK